MSSILLLGLLGLFQGPTSSIRGLVQTETGEPRVGAEVFLVSPEIPLFQAREVLHAKTDKRGRFRIGVRGGKTYWAWSSFKGDKGLFRLSALRREASPGQILILKEVERRFPQRLRLQGFEAWGKAEELRVHWDLHPSLGFREEVPVDAKGEVDIPSTFPMGGRGVHFVLRGKEGVDLFEGWLPRRGAPEGGGAKGGLGGRGESRTQPRVFSCPEPRLLSLRVRTKAKTPKGEAGKGAKALGGTQVYFRIGFLGIWCRGPRSDASGRIRLQVPKDAHGITPLTLSLVRPGFQSSNLLIWQGKSYVNGRALPSEPDPSKRVYDLELFKDRPFPCKLLDPRGEGWKGGVLRLRTYLRVFKSKDSIMRIPGRSFSLRLGKDGSTLLPSLPHNLLRLQAEAFLSMQGLRFFLPEESIAPPQPLLKLYWDAMERGERKLGGDLRNYRLYPFVVRGPDGGLASFPWLRFEQKPDEVLHHRGDRLGRFSLLLPKTKATFAGFVPEKGYFFEAHADFSWSKDFVAPQREILLRQPRTQLRGVVTDSSGKPLKDVRVSLVGWSQLDENPRASAVHEILSGLLRGKTNQKGEFSVPYLEAPGLILKVGFGLPGRKKKVVAISEVPKWLEVEL